MIAQETSGCTPLSAVPFARVGDETDPLYIAIRRAPIPNTRWFWHPRRTQLYQGSEQGEFVPLNRWGAPRLDGVVRYGAADAVEGQRIEYLLTVGGHTERVSYDALVSGRAWEAWAYLGVDIAKRAQIAEYVAVVASQITLARAGLFPGVTAIPVYTGGRATGWTRTRDGKHALTLPNGQSYGSDGAVPGEYAYLRLPAHHAAPYPDVIPVGDRAAQEAALAFYARVSAGSLAGLLLCADLGSILYGVCPSDYSVIVRGPTQRGKTGLTSELRNLTGVFPWGTQASAAMMGPTTTRMETMLHSLKHLPMTLDDGVERGGMAAADLAEFGKKNDMVLRAHANHEPLRPRSTRTLEGMPDNSIDAVPILTYEALPTGMLPSALARALLLDVAEGSIDKRALARDAATHRDGLRGVGHGVIATIARTWDVDGDALPAAWADWHADMTERLAALLTTRHGAPLPDEATRLPSNGAWVLLASELLRLYCDGAHIACPFTPDALTPDLIEHLEAQIGVLAALATGSADGVPLDAWACEHLHAALARGDVSARMQDGGVPTPGGPLAPDDCGWRVRNQYLPHDHDGNTTSRTEVFEYLPASGPWLGVLDDDMRYLYCDKAHLYDLLKRAAAREKREWHLTSPDALTAALARVGLVVPAGDGRLLRSIRVRGHRQRRVCIDAARIWPERDTPDDDDNGDTPEGPAPTPLHPTPAPAATITLDITPSTDSTDGTSDGALKVTGDVRNIPVSAAGDMVPVGKRDDAPSATPGLAARYAGAALKTRWHGSPISTGLALVLEHNIKRGWFDHPTTRYSDMEGAPAHRGHGLTPAWRRPLTHDEQTGPCVQVFDMNSAYLAAASGADLPYGVPTWEPRAAWAKRAGVGWRSALWRVSVAYASSAWDGAGLPAVCPEGDEIWLWTPTLRTAIACGYDVQPHGAVLWPEQHRVLGTWQQTVWQARRALETNMGGAYPEADARAEAVGLVKAVYTRTLGMFAHMPEERPDDEACADPRWYRPEWQCMIHALAAARLFVVMQKAVKLGGSPLWCRTDALAFVGGADARAVGARAGLNLTPHQCGAFRPEWHTTPAEIASSGHLTIEHHTVPAIRAGARAIAGRA